MTKNLNILIDEELRKEFKIACDKQGITMTAVIIEFIKEYLSNEKVSSS